MKNLFFLPIICLTLSACGVSKTSNETVESPTENTAPPTENVVEEPKVEEPEEEIKERSVYQATETILSDLVHTKLEVNFNWEKSQLNGIATITAKQHFYPSNEFILDAKGMEINKVLRNEKSLKFTYADDILILDLGKEFSKDEEFTVVIDYIAKPDEREEGGSSAITSDKGLYFINPTGEDKNKMPQIWTQGETEASSVWFPTIDSPNAKTTQEIFITVEDKYKTLSNGKLVSSKKHRDGTRTDHWKQDLPHTPYLFMMGVGEFSIVKDTYKRANGKYMEVNYYVEPEWKEYADDIFGETPEMIAYFSEILGVEYPWDKYHQIVVRDYVSGAMENTGAVIFGDFVYKTDRELLDDDDQSTIAHELFHHWFGDLVTCESWSNLPLNESFANYSQYLWDEYRYGNDQADYYAEAEADGYYQSAQMQGHHDLIWLDYDEKEQMFDGHSYNKGGRILHMLRDYLGDDAFFAGLKEYLTENKFQPAEFHQLRLAFEEVSGQDLNWFFNQWFLSSGHPVLNFEQEQSGDSVQLTITQNQDLELSPLYKLPIAVAIFDENGKAEHNIVIDEYQETFSFPVSGELKTLIPDFHQVLLAKVSEDKSQEQFIQQYYLGEKYRARERALRFGTSEMDSTIAQKLIMDALKDDFWGIRKQAIELAEKLQGENEEKARQIITEMANSDKKSSVRAAAIGYLSAKDGDEAVFVKALQSDKSYLVASTALNNLGESNPEKAMQHAKALENEPSSKMKSGIAGLYAEYGGAEQFSFFQKTLTDGSLSGFDELGAMNSFTVYLAKQKANLWSKSWSIYRSLNASGGNYTQMFLPQNLEYLKRAVAKNIRTTKKDIAKLSTEGDSAAASKKESSLQEWEKMESELQNLVSSLQD